jgi:hypothetical protein
LIAGFLVLAFGLTGSTPRGEGAGPDALLPGKQLLLTGKFQQAAAWFHAAKQKHPGDARVYFYCGVAFTKLGDFSSAAWELNEAVRLQPNRPEYQIYQANTLERLNHKNQARHVVADLDVRRLAGILPANDLQLLGEVYYRLEIMMKHCKCSTFYPSANLRVRTSISISVKSTSPNANTTWPRNTSSAAFRKDPITIHGLISNWERFSINRTSWLMPRRCCWFRQSKIQIVRNICIGSAWSAWIWVW